MRAPFWLARLICWWKVNSRLKSLRPTYTVEITPDIHQIVREPISGSNKIERANKFDTRRVLLIEIWSTRSATGPIFKTRLIWSDYLGAWCNELQPDKVDNQINLAIERVLIAMDRALATTAQSDLPQQSA